MGNLENLALKGRCCEQNTLPRGLNVPATRLAKGPAEHGCTGIRTSTSAGPSCPWQAHNPGHITGSDAKRNGIVGGHHLDRDSLPDTT